MTKFREWFQSHKYCLVLLYLPVYLLYFAYLQMFPAQHVHIIECALDRLIPTVPLFFIPYALWWILFPGSLLYFLFYGGKKNFLKLCFLIFSGYTICLFVYTVWPNGLELREPLAGKDLLTKGILWLRSIDPPVNVCPSMHVSSTTAIDITVRGEKKIPRRIRNTETVLAVLICVSTLMIRQHSLIDVFLGWVMCLFLYQIWRIFLDKRMQ